MSETEPDDKKAQYAEHSVWIRPLIAGCSQENLFQSVLPFEPEHLTDIYLPQGKDYGFIRFGRKDAAEAFCKKLTDDLDSVSHIFAGGRGLRSVMMAVNDRVPHKDGATYGGAMPLPPGIVVLDDLPAAPVHRRGDRAPRRPVAHAPEYSVLVIGLVRGTTVQDVQEALDRVNAATPNDIYLPLSRHDIAFVRYRDPEQAKELIALTGHVLVRGVPVALTQANVDKRASNSCKKALTVYSDVVEEVAEEPAYGGGREKPAHCIREVEEVQQHDEQWRAEGQQGNILGSARSEEKVGAATWPGISLMITKLPLNADRRCLVDALLKAGVDSVRDLYVPQGRNYGFVRFRSFGDAYRAYEMLQGGLDFHGVTLAVQVSTTQPKRHYGQPWVAKQRGYGSGAPGRSAADFMEAADAVGCSLLADDDAQQERIGVEGAVEPPASERERELERQLESMRCLVEEQQAEIEHSRAASELRQAHMCGVSNPSIRLIVQSQLM
eukprot:TRINITY_DN24430_c0_g1_i1.p1 TRINITY_DN24430_c0_g1~~TRINITY_DN24430_c0_g1_i1.p1  ORF type:complete len:495 (-),score=71.31 TRINITY_DN24430_c0_g1_i1:12-1496(-)